MALVTSNGSWTSRANAFLFGFFNCWGTGQKFVKFTANASSDFVVLDVNENLGGYVSAGGSYEFGHMRQGGEYVTNFTGRYEGKSVDFSVMVRGCDADVVRDDVAYFTNYLANGCPVVHLAQKFTMLDTRLANCDVVYTDYGREAVISFTLVSSYPFLLDGRMFRPTPFSANADRDGWAVAYSTTSLNFPAILAGAGTGSAPSVELRANNHISTDYGAEKLVYTGTSVKAVADGHFLAWVGGNFGVLRWVGETGILYPPFPAKSSVGYPLMLPLSQKTQSFVNMKAPVYYSRVYL